MSLSNEFEQLKKDLKDKWLDYYKANRGWIGNLSCWCNQPSEGKRPNAEFILGIVSFLEPQLISYLPPMLEIDSGGESVVKVLGLNFDPRIELRKKTDKYNKSVEDIQRLYYFFLANRGIKNDIISSLLGIYFIVEFDYDYYLKKLEQCIEELTQMENILQLLDQDKNSLMLSSQSYIDPDTEYLNRIREQIAREKEKENANL